MENYYSEHSKFYVSVDCIVLGYHDKELKLLLGKRKLEPGRGEWALYGGFVESDESLEEASNRTLFELTGMKNIYMRQVGVYGNLDRDPFDRVISVAYCALININDYDDNLRIKHDLEWISLNKIPTLFADHGKMVNTAIKQIQSRINTEPLIFNLLPDLFTLTQLQHVYEAVLGGETDKRNFRKRIKQIALIEKTELIDKVTSKRGAALYRFNSKAYKNDTFFKL